MHLDDLLESALCCPVRDACPRPRALLAVAPTQTAAPARAPAPAEMRAAILAACVILLQAARAPARPALPAEGELPRRR